MKAKYYLKKFREISHFNYRPYRGTSNIIYTYIIQSLKSFWILKTFKLLNVIALTMHQINIANEQTFQEKVFRFSFQ